MANAINIPTTSSNGVLLQQLLHGYSNGHRLIEGSFRPSDDISRLMLRLSDLSGVSTVSGFEEYLTGYPLPALDSFAIAKTWPAPEMPRPGCVWTHTLVIQNADFAKIKDLRPFLEMFARPAAFPKGEYSEAISWNLPQADAFLPNSEPDEPTGVRLILKSFYENPSTGIIIPASSAKDFENAIFEIWSQQWPSLRSSLTFCTGSLSSRTFGDRPFDIQTVPQSLLHQVMSDTSSSNQRPVLVDTVSDDSQNSWSLIAAQDAVVPMGGGLRAFLWNATESSNGRNEFIRFVKIYESVTQLQPIADVISLVAKSFPQKAESELLKKKLFWPSANDPNSPWSEYNLLLALGSTEFHESFDAEALSLHDRGRRFPKEHPRESRKLLNELFRSSNVLGEVILSGFIAGLTADTARFIIAEQPRYLPAIFRANPKLACYPELWEAAGHNRWELLESLPSGQEIDNNLIGKIVGAILSSQSDQFELLRRSIAKWKQPAIFGTLDWIDSHDGNMTDGCRRALTYEDSTVAEWVAQRRSKSLGGVIAAAHIVAPYSYKLFDRDTTSWREAFLKLRPDSNNMEAVYFATFLLALAFGNSPPNALALVSETFELVHSFFETAYRHSKFDRIADESWVIMDPLLPHLSFVFEWDKCERLRRGLVEAFIKHGWPAIELRKCIRDFDVILAILKSARRIDGGAYYFRELDRTRY